MRDGGGQVGGATPHHSGTLRSGRGVGGRGVREAEWAVRLRGSGGRSRMRPFPQLRPGWSGSYLVVDTVVIAAAFLDGHAVLAVVEEALVTLAALSTAVWTLGGGTECGAAQGAGVCAELVVAVGGTLHCFKLLGLGATCYSETNKTFFFRPVYGAP